MYANFCSNSMYTLTSLQILWLLEYGEQWECIDAIPQAIYSTIFDLRGPRRRLRLCPRANKNLHIPAGYPPGYAQSILLHNICLQGGYPQGRASDFSEIGTTSAFPYIPHC
ncbi:hypothetical protein T02_7618 [Trichinella nativa]|uniref:Uncharacterized protein n=1 Tax=Trichinella nativa TaxID=6335 RepID=A0A0V1KN44_9BILA|nr:hypothetical protein T02_7618 [Trichinella nativa]